ncbi:MAG: hypothetical protein Q9218_006422, partial [Villophora microphyllina]
MDTLGRNYRRDRHHPSSLDPWIHVSFRINAYTFDEWPLQELSDLDNVSIGEEQSSGTVVALSWSPLALAKHKRFALAILTSNHLLSLWAPTSDPKIAASWERVLVINEALGTFAEANVLADGVDRASHERLRQLMRVRAMSWAPAGSTNTQNFDEAASSLSPGSQGQVQHLAVTDDVGHVAVLQIKSPWSDHRSTDWEAQSIFHVSWDALQKPLADHIQDRVAMEEDHAPTPASGQPFWPSLFASCLSTEKFIDSVICLSGSPSYVALASADTVRLFSLRDSYAQVGSLTQELPLVDEWDEISGLAFPASTGDTDPLLHVTGFLSGCWSCRVDENPPTFHQSSSRTIKPVRSLLYDQAVMLQKDFDQHHDLGGLSFAKTWGLASWGPYLVTCVTFHPGDMVEYMLPSKERCHIVFMKEDTGNVAQETASFPWQEISTTTSERNTQVVLRGILRKAGEQRAALAALDRRILYCVCCATMILCELDSLDLVDDVLQKLSKSLGSSLEPELDLLAEVASSGISTALCIERLNNISTSRAEHEPGHSTNDLYDMCSICDRIILWQGATEAVCVSGHQFVRCALTFLPIKEPGISRYCETCNREFLDEAFYQEGNDDQANHRTRLTADGNQENFNEYVVVNTVPDAMDVDKTAGEDLDTMPDIGLTTALFATFDHVPHTRDNVSSPLLARQETSTATIWLFSMTSSLATSTTGDKRISLYSIQSDSPKIIQGPLSPPISLKANISFGNLMASSYNASNRKPSVATSSGSSNNANRTLDRFDMPSSADETDPDEEIAAYALADFINYPNDSHTAVQSPPPRHHFRSGSVSIPNPSGSASFVTSSSIQPDASIRAMKSPRGSASTGGSCTISSAINSADARKQSVDSAVSNSSPDGFPASEAVATLNDAGDSPTLGHFPLPPAAIPKKGKARDSMLLHRYSHASDGEPKARKDSTPTINTQNTEAEAEKRLTIPFLPKFLKLAGSPRQSMSAATDPERDSMEITKVDEIPPKPQEQPVLKSAFEADSSDDEDGDPYDRKAFIGGAKLASLRQSQAQVVENRKSKAHKVKKVVSLQDILKEGGIEAVADHLQPSGTSVLADVNPGPSTLKAKRLLGESSIKMKRAGIVGMPAVQENGGGVPITNNEADEPVREKPRSWQVGLFDGLRSNPVKRAATAPTGKKVVLPLDIGIEQKNVRNSIVSTPYPLGYKGRKSGEEQETARPPGHSLDDGKRAKIKGEATIILVLYSRSRNTPIIRKTILPDPTKSHLFLDDEKRPPFRATRTTIDFDDEQLFLLLKKEYHSMIGLVKTLASARSVHGISLLGYHRLSQLAAKEHRPARRKTFRVYDDIFTEQRLMDLWTSPNKGRKKHEWVEWIRSLPPPPHHHLHNNDTEGSHYPTGDDENVALEVVEGWNVRKIAFAFALILVLSVLATLLWVFLGFDGAVVLKNDAM